MKADEIAKTFSDQGLSGKWLSAKRAAWLYDQACREAGNRKLTTHGTRTATGQFTNEQGEMMSWSIALSPVNGCAVFHTENITEIVRQQEAERAEREAATARVIHVALERGFSLEQIAAMWFLPLERVQGYLSSESEVQA